MPFAQALFALLAQAGGEAATWISVVSLAISAFSTGWAGYLNYRSGKDREQVATLSADNADLKADNAQLRLDNAHLKLELQAERQRYEKDMGEMRTLVATVTGEFRRMVHDQRGIAQTVVSAADHAVAAAKHQGESK